VADVVRDEHPELWRFWSWLDSLPVRSRSSRYSSQDRQARCQARNVCARHHFRPAQKGITTIQYCRLNVSTPVGGAS